MTEQVSFVIESIEKHRMSKKHGETEFYIKWQGYGPEENTWEVRPGADGFDGGADRGARCCLNCFFSLFGLSTDLY